VERYGAAGTTLDQRRTSSIVEMAMLLAEAVQHGLRTIAFCKSRKLCELVTAYTRETLKVSAPALCNMVKVRLGALQDRSAVYLVGHVLPKL
jgi:DEAD/DEAH box helicase domain-containing protein